MKNIIKNFVYQSVFQLSKILIPIITLPLASKALGPYGIGIYNYTYSIAQYFVLFAGLGVTLYGSREIAICKMKGNNLSQLFSEIFIMKMIVSSISIILFIIIAGLSNHSTILLIQSMTIVAILLDVSWFFMGIEKFKFISLSNSIAQFIVLIIVVMFVKQPSDLIIYVLSQALGLTIPSVLTLFFAKKYINFSWKKIRKTALKEHFTKSLSFFLPQISVMFYSNLNKTLLGIVVGATAVGYYSNSLTLNTVFITLLSTIDTVLLPKMSALSVNNTEETILKYLKKFCNIQFYFSIALFFGILSIYDKLIPWFLGDQFEFVNNLLPLFSLLIIVNPLAGSIARQYLLPIGNTYLYNKSAIYGALISILINVLFLAKLGIYASVFAYIFAELFVLVTRLYSLYRTKLFKLDHVVFIKLSLCGFIMFLIIRTFTKDLSPSLSTNIIQSVLGVAVYIVLTFFAKLTPLHFLREKMKID